MSTSQSSRMRLSPGAKVGLCLLGITLVAAGLRLFRLDSVPPGLHFDEAVYGLMASDIYNGERPIFFPAYTGREPLYMYLVALVFRVVGITTYGLRLTSVLIGIGTVPLVYLLWRGVYSPRVGLLSALLTGLSYWHLTASRNAYPNILIPPIECLAMYCLWRGYRDFHAGWAALGGALMGLILYTYLAARFFPVTVAAIFVYALVMERTRRKERWGLLALAALAALSIFAPLGIYFLQHPAYFTERASQVLLLGRGSAGEQVALLAKNLVGTLGGLFVRGDPQWHHNLPGRPIFSPWMAPFLLAGLAVALRRWRQPAYTMLAIWYLGMCLPAILTNEPMPQGQRMIGIIPPIYGLAALGMDHIIRLAGRIAGRKWPGRLLKIAPAMLISVLFVLEGIVVVRDYFGR